MFLKRRGSASSFVLQKATRQEHRADFTEGSGGAGLGSQRATLIGNDQVAMPWGGGGMACTVLASSGVQPAGGQSVANTHVMSDPGCAALGAMRPAHPSRQSCSPAR